VIWLALYVTLLAVLFIRVRPPESVFPEPARPLPGEPLRLVALHHAVFYLLLLAAPLEWAILGGRPGGRGLGALILTAGVVAYRRAGTALGDSLSPFVEPRAGAPLVTSGLYRHIRHPMYLGQVLIAIGAPLTLGSRYTLALATAAVLVLVIRVVVEEEALARTFPEYPHYAARTKRLLPFVF
jgi:protein-S-isoprenylcysteine O-methyltransferase Ste14